MKSFSSTLCIEEDGNTMDNPSEHQVVYRVCIAMLIWVMHRHFWPSGLLYLAYFVFSPAFLNTPHVKFCLLPSSPLIFTMHFDIITRGTCRCHNFCFLISGSESAMVSLTSTPEHSCLSWKYLWAGKGKCKAAQGLMGDGLWTSNPDKVFYITHLPLDHPLDFL